jgi:sugar phosphate isomerase/epimerase
MSQQIAVASLQSTRMTTEIALQLYTVRREFEANPERTLERIKTIGINAVEVAPLPDSFSVQRLAGLLRAQSLRVVAVHCDLPLADRKSEVLKAAKEFSCDRIIWHGWPRDAAFDTLEGIKRLSDDYNQACSNAAGHGIRFGLHNHWWEFETVQGQYPYRLLLERLAPEVFLEIDTYWVRTAGLDPAAILAELKDRVTFLHLKDGPARKGEPMTALGSGVMDFPSVLAAASAKVKSLVIELDECETSIWDAVQQSFQYLRAVCGRILVSSVPDASASITPGRESASASEPQRRWA